MNHLEQDLRYGAEAIEHGVRHGVQDVERGVQRATVPVNKVLHWGPWELVTHLSFALLFLYVLYVFYAHGDQRTLTHWLLLLVALGIGVQIHQNVNLQQGLWGKAF